MPAPIFLIGFMAAGKTTVGRLVAARLGRRFVDLDDVIAEAAGTSAAALVAADEAAFRRREADALAQVIAGATDGPVIATGGGAAAHGDNLDRMRAAGLVVALAASLPEVRRRAEGGPPRPLLSRDDAALAALAATRERHYRRAHVGIATDDVAPDEVATTIATIADGTAALSPADARAATWVGVGRRSYPIVTRGDGFSAALVRAAVPGATRLAIVTDEHLAATWLGALTAELPDAIVVRVAPGEASKSLATYGRVCDELVGHGLDRGGAIVALGGGVVGDLAGLVAATLYRGVPWVQLPTTLVAMTDSAIGGKTGIDLAAGKNLVGAFWQPALVACHLPVLATLPARERRAGFGELWKYALLDGRALWDQIDALAPWAAAGEGVPAPPDAAAVIARAAACKAWVVGQDERELTRPAHAAQPRPHRRPRDRGRARHPPRRGGRPRAGGGVPGLGRARGRPARAGGRGRRRARPLGARRRPAPPARRRRDRADRGGQEAARVHREIRRGSRGGPV